MTLSVNAHTPKVETTIQPQPVKFRNSTGAIAQYYFRNNPWKLSPINDHQKFFRFCAVCGQKRFSDQDWKIEWIRSASLWRGNSGICCPNESCQKASTFLADFVPLNVYWLDGMVSHIKGDNYENLPSQMHYDSMLRCKL